MGFNRANLRKIKNEYAGKNLAARESAEARRAELDARFPEVAEIDRELESFSLEYLAIVADREHFEENFEKLRQKNLALNGRKRAFLTMNGIAPDYDEVKYECPECSDTGYCGIKMCRCMYDRLVRLGYESSGIGKLRDCSFGNFSLDYYNETPEVYKNAAHVLNVCRKTADTFPECSGNLLLLGGTGLGKTHLCAAIAGRVIENGHDVVFESMENIVGSFEYEKFRRGNDTVTESKTDRYFDCDMLIIDDLGAEMTGNLSSSVLYNIVNTRLINGRGTVINTNLDPAKITSVYGERITSRLFGEYTVLMLNGKDIRQKKRKKP